jgi:hypothetical protein
MKIKIEMELPRWLSRTILVGIPVAIVAIGAWVYAGVPNTFTAGNVLTAKQLNDNFKALQDAIDRTAIATANGHSLRGSAVFCGSTSASMQGGGINGYVSAKTLCETECSSPTAHMCIADEVARSLMLGVRVTTDGWYAGGLGVRYAGPTADSAHWGADCLGWTTSDSSNVGLDWNSNGLTFSTCDNSFRIHCCD